MPVVITCPNGHKLRVKDELAGKRVACPNCKVAFQVPVADRSRADGFLAELGEESTSAPINRCPSCGEDLQRDSVLCVNCGFDLRTGRLRGGPRPAGKPRGHAVSRTRRRQARSSNDSRRLLIVGGVVAGVVVIAITGLLFFGGNGSAQPSARGSKESDAIATGERSSPANSGAVAPTGRTADDAEPSRGASSGSGSELAASNAAAAGQSPDESSSGRGAGASTAALEVAEVEIPDDWNLFQPADLGVAFRLPPDWDELPLDVDAQSKKLAEVATTNREFAVRLQSYMAKNTGFLKHYRDQVAGAAFTALHFSPETMSHFDLPQLGLSKERKAYTYSLGSRVEHRVTQYQSRSPSKIQRSRVQLAVGEAERAQYQMEYGTDDDGNTVLKTITVYWFLRDGVLYQMSVSSVSEYHAKYAAILDKAIYTVRWAGESGDAPTQ